MKKIAFLLFSFACLNIISQDDPKAKAILDDLSKITKTHKTVVADFNIIVLNKDKKQTEKAQVCKIQVKGQMFRLEIPGNIIVCDGKTIWNHNKDAAEVTIKTFDPNNEDQLSPNKLFTIYETGYKYKFDKEEKVGLVMCNVVDLFPSVKPEKKNFTPLNYI